MMAPRCRSICHWTEQRVADVVGRSDFAAEVAAAAAVLGSKFGCHRRCSAWPRWPDCSLASFRWRI